MICNYWSSSKLADRIRGIDKPRSLPLGEWDKWEGAAKKERPIRYWFSDTLLDAVQNFLWWPFGRINNARHYLRNRFIDRVHVLPTRLPKGQWSDFDHRLLHAMMEGVVDYVELELGFEGPRRSRYRGVKHLMWEMDLKKGEQYFLEPNDPEFDSPTDQADSAKEVYELYTWWKDKRPNRVDPWDSFEEDQVEGKYDCINQLEQEYLEEDTEMLIRLVKIRGSMWT